jgi:hypothetical protein
MKKAPTFHMPKITGHRTQNRKLALQNDDLEVIINEESNKLEVENGSGIVGTVDLHSGKFESLALGINEYESGNHYPFKDANLKYDTKTISITTNGQKQICYKEQEGELPDIILTEDGALGVLDTYYSCQNCKQSLSLFLKDSGSRLLDESGKEISVWNALDVYHGDKKISTYQSKIAGAKDDIKFYLATSGEDLRFIESEGAHLTKAKLIADQIDLQLVELKLSADQDNSELNLQLFYQGAPTDSFGAKKSSNNAARQLNRSSRFFAANTR